MLAKKFVKLRCMVPKFKNEIRLSKKNICFIDKYINDDEVRF